VDRSSAIEQVYDEIDSLLASTLTVDDYVDLNALRATAAHPAFDRQDLESPIPVPERTPIPAKPVLAIPPAPSGLMSLFGKKRHEAAVVEARHSYDTAMLAWEEACKAIRLRDAEAIDAHAKAEARRVQLLVAERARYERECAAREAEVRDQNQRLDELIANLGYGVPDAVQEYVSIVLANSSYPDHFKVAHEFQFDAAASELFLKVTIPAPTDLPAIKGYKYVKASDEIVEVPLPQKEARERYAFAVHQVALRSFHEVFESDRRGLVATISLEVGTETIDPATGRLTFVPFVIGAAERGRFLQLNLSAVVPSATLGHLGAAVSKNPYALVGVDRSGARRA